MSAEDQGSAAPAVEGPVIITVIGQEGHPESAPAVEAKTETAPAAEAPAADATKAAGSEEPAPEESRDEKGRFKPGVQNRIDELTRARREAEREAEYWKARAQPAAPAKAAEANQPPVRENFESDDQYIEAMADYKVDQKLSQREAQQKVVQEQTSKAETWQSKMDAARAEIQDFDAIMEGADFPVANHVAELIMEHDHGPKLMHHFAQNPAEVEKLNAMSPAKAAFELGKLATKFDAAPDTASSKPAAAAPVSKAPPPAGRQVGAGRATTPALGDLSMDDYIAARKAQGAGWAR